MKNWINKIPKEKLQKYIFLGMLVLVFVAFFISLSLIEQKDKPKNPDDDDHQTPIDDDDDDEDIITELFVMPIKNNDYKIVRKYYDKNNSEEDRLLAVINYGSTYMMSEGICIRAKDDKVFDVICSFGGVVEDVTESPLHGTIVTVSHADGVLTEYSSLASTTVKAGDVLKQGDILGVAGECEYDQDSKIHVQFKILKDDKSYNPEKLIGKALKDVK